LPHAESFSLSLVEALALINAPEANKSKEVVIIAHSLGSHIALDLQKRINNVIGIILLAPVSCRPHKALLGEKGFWLVKWMGLNISKPYIGRALQLYLYFLYRIIFRFPQSTRLDEIAWTQERVAQLNFELFTQQVKESETPILLAYAEDDHLIEKERFDELGRLVKERSSNKVVVFKQGGHNIQKVKVKEIIQEINSWLKL